MPIYVGGQSADVWANRHLFELTATGAPALVSGVPPDAFSETGQLWGSPLYDWKVRAGSGGVYCLYCLPGAGLYCTAWWCGAVLHACWPEGV